MKEVTAIKTKRSAKDMVNKIAGIYGKICSVLMLVAMNVNFVFAGGEGGGGADVIGKIDTVVNNILTYVAIGGALVMLFGIFSVIMAIREEDAGRKSSGILNIVVGALLVSLKVVVWNVIKGLMNG